MHSVRGAFALLCAATLATGSMLVWAAAPELLELSIEQLLQVEVSAAPKHLQAAGPVPLAVVSAAPDPARARAYRAIAEALLNFPRFIEWPGEAAGDFRICIAGRDPFGPGLDALATHSVRARPIRIERQASDFSACQMVFVPAGTALPTPAVGTLVVAEDAVALSQGAAIVVRLDGTRVVFDIDSRAAARAGLKISSKLLRLARASSTSPADRGAGLAVEGR